MWLGSSQQLHKVNTNDIFILNTHVRVTETEQDLAVVIGRQMSLAAHVSALCRSSYHQLQQLHPLVGSLSADASETLVPMRSYHPA